MVPFCWEPNRGLLLLFTMLCLVAKKLEESKNEKEIVFLNTLLSMDPQGKLHFSRDQTRNCLCSFCDALLPDFFFFFLFYSLVLHSAGFPMKWRNCGKEDKFLF